MNAHDDAWAQRIIDAACDEGEPEALLAMFEEAPFADSQKLRKRAVSSLASTLDRWGERASLVDVLNSPVVLADDEVGGRGRDVLRGRRGRDEIKGGPGADAAYGGPGRDRLKMAADDEGGADRTIDCGPGRDVAYIDARVDPAPVACERVRKARRPPTQ